VRTTLFPDAVITGELLEPLRGLPDRYELVEGRIVALSRTGAERAEAVARLARILGNTIDRRGWIVQAGEGGIYSRRRPDSIGGADVAVISRIRRAPHDPSRAFLTVAPELIIEVLTPGNEEADMNDKVREYLRAGAEAVWLIDLAARTLTIVVGRPEPQTDIRRAEDSGTVRLPDGTAVKVSDLFPD
jgi:Uma2 family endonuclease